MSVSKSRRAFLANAAFSCISLPLLRVLRESEAKAEGSGAKRAIIVYYPDGNIESKFFPKGQGAFSSLPAITSPLKAVQQYVALVKGLEFRTTGSHEAGAAFCLTGVTDAAKRYSIDNFLGDRLGGSYPQKTLRLGVGANFQGGADKYVSYLLSGALAPIQDHPRLAFQEIFSSPGLSSGEKEQINRGKKSVFDYARGEIVRVKQQIGSLEAKKLDEHLSSLRELERRVNLAASSGARCQANIDMRGLTFPEQETSYPKSYELNENFAKISGIMTDIMIEAMACGVAPTGLLQWSHAVSPTQFDFVGGPGVAKGHHDASHFGGDPESETGKMFVACQTWYMQQVAHLIDKLKSVQVNGGSLLDETILLVTTEIGDSERHDFKNIACLIAGGSKTKLNGGQALELQGRSYNDLLTSVSHAMGIHETFGDASLGNGPISELFKA